MLGSGHCQAREREGRQSPGERWGEALLRRRGASKHVGFLWSEQSSEAAVWKGVILGGEENPKTVVSGKQQNEGLQEGVGV